MGNHRKGLRKLASFREVLRPVELLASLAETAERKENRVQLARPVESEVVGAEQEGEGGKGVRGPEGN